MTRKQKTAMIHALCEAITIISVVSITAVLKSGICDTSDNNGLDKQHSKKVPV